MSRASKQTRVGLYVAPVAEGTTWAWAWIELASFSWTSSGREVGKGGQASRDMHLPTITFQQQYTHVIQLVWDTCDVIRNHGYGIQPLPISRLSRCCILCCRQRRNIPPKSLVISIVPETSMNRADPMPKSDPGRPFSHPYANLLHLVTGTAGLGDDALELVDLRLGAAESSELGK